MDSFEIGVIVVLLCVAAFQAWLTMRVWRSNLYDSKQKIMQIELVWLLPIVGASLVFYVLREDEAAHRTAHARLDK